jgi:hypothetical protein
MFRLTIVAALLTASIAAYAPAQSTQSDALGKCLADNTTGKDRKELAKWIFLAMAAHPEIKQYTNANTLTGVEESSHTVATLITRLLTDSCADETRAVVKVDGSAALKLSFEKLGQLAMQELMSDRSVTESVGHFERYLDQKRFEELRSGK